MPLEHKGSIMSTEQTKNNVKALFDASIKAKQEANIQLSIPITLTIDVLLSPKED